MHPILYKITTAGAVQTWKLEREGAKFRSHVGQLGGAIVISAWTTCKGKNVGRSNETSPEDQAKLEVEAQYVLKKKKGYCLTVEAARESDRFQCMLADKYPDRKAKLFDTSGCTVVGEIFVQPKLDGIRCIARKEGLFSRENNPILAVPHIKKLLEPLFAVHPDLILDGELYNHELKHDFNEIVSLVKKQKPTSEDLQASAEMVQYWVYDCVMPDRDAVFSERFAFLSASIRVLAAYGGSITDVPTHATMYEKPGVDMMYEQHLADGFEGSMIRINMPYEFKRSKNLLKRKEMQDAEFTVISIDEGAGNAEGMAKIAHMVTKNGIEFDADVVGPHKMLRELWLRVGELAGKQATIVFQNYTPDGKPRFGKLKVVHMEGRW